MVPVAVSIEPRLSFAVESAPEMTDFAARVYDPSQLNSSSSHTELWTCRRRTNFRIVYLFVLP